MTNLSARPRRIVGVFSAIVAFALVLAGSTVYTAHGDTDDETYYACLFAGSLSQVNTSGPPANCGRGEQVQWNAEGQPGAPGAPGADGINCWDLNGDGVNDPAEDTYPAGNPDGIFDARDCQGPEGEQGPPGPSSQLDCEGCVGNSDLAAGSVTTDKMRANAQQDFSSAIVNDLNPTGSTEATVLQIPGSVDHLVHVTGQVQLWVLETDDFTSDVHWQVHMDGVPVGLQYRQTVTGGTRAVVPFSQLVTAEPGARSFTLVLGRELGGTSFIADVELTAIDLGQK